MRSGGLRVFSVGTFSDGRDRGDDFIPDGPCVVLAASVEAARTVAATLLGEAVVLCGEGREEASLRDLGALLREALDRQVRPCDHTGIGLPGCRTCDPRVRDYRRELPVAEECVGGEPPRPDLGMCVYYRTGGRTRRALVDSMVDDAEWVEVICDPKFMIEIRDLAGRLLWRRA